MALPGPAPKESKIGRTPNADWTDVPNELFEAGRARELPARYGFDKDEDGNPVLTERGWVEQTESWWDVVRTLPHAALWTEADWLFASDTAVLKDLFYTGIAKAGEMTEMRRREDLLGLSAEARRKLRIRYVAPRPERAADGPAAASVTPITGGTRKRRQIAEDA